MKIFEKGLIYGVGFYKNEENALEIVVWEGENTIRRVLSKAEAIELAKKILETFRDPYEKIWRKYQQLKAEGKELGLRIVKTESGGVIFLDY